MYPLDKVGGRKFILGVIGLVSVTVLLILQRIEADLFREIATLILGAYFLVNQKSKEFAAKVIQKEEMHSGDAL